MVKKILAQGAEALIILEKDYIIKDRVKKGYRIKEIDDKIRRQRTRTETRILEKASSVISSAKPIRSENPYQIKMPLIKGKKLSECLDSFSLEKQKKICNEVGKMIAEIHRKDIIHGDLTTSNMIFLEKENKISMIDFGLGFNSSKIEDKAVDLHLLERALEAKHFQNSKVLFEEVIKGYTNLLKEQSNPILDRLKIVKSRGRYKH